MLADNPTVNLELTWQNPPSETNKGRICNGVHLPPWASMIAVLITSFTYHYKELKENKNHKLRHNLPRSKILIVFSYSFKSERSCRSMAALRCLASLSSGVPPLTQPPILKTYQPNHANSLSEGEKSVQGIRKLIS